jgi:hypothetical protein
MNGLDASLAASLDRYQAAYDYDTDLELAQECRSDELMADPEFMRDAIAGDCIDGNVSFMDMEVAGITAEQMQAGAKRTYVYDALTILLNSPTNSVEHLSAWTAMREALRELAFKQAQGEIK